MSDSKKKWINMYDYDESMHGVDLYSNYTQIVIQKGHHIIRKICKEAYKEKSHKLNILDIGCGDADLYRLFNDISDNYIGLEPIKREIQKAKQGNNKYFIRGTAEELPLVDNCIDIGLHISTLDHCYGDKESMLEFNRVLKPNGLGIILLENKGRVSNWIRNLLGFEVSHGEEHFYYFNVKEIMELIPPNSKLIYKYSYGFLLGFNVVSKFLPKIILKYLSGIMDFIFGYILPNSGQHFIVVIKKEDSGNSEDLGIICPNCKKQCEFKPQNCNNCNYKFEWISETTVDYIPEIP